MKRLAVLLFLLPALAIGSPIPPEWNPEGVNLWRLFRIPKSDDLNDIRNDFEKLMVQTRYDKALTAEQVRARTAVMYGARQILTDELYNRLYGTFGDALDNRFLTASPDISVPMIEPSFLDSASKASNPVAEADGAGLIHYAYFHDFYTLQTSNPETQIREYDALARAFDKYLAFKGVTGLHFQLERALGKKSTEGFFSDFWKQVPAAKVAVISSALACAMVLGAAGSHYLRTPPPDKRQEQVEALRVDPQEQANQDAQEFGRETAQELLNPLP
jgi:hypothetical protein